MTPQQLDDVVKKWLRFRKEWQAKPYAPNEGSVAEFINAMNGISAEFVSLIGNRNVDFLEALGELATHASVQIKLEL
jgi:hypothetical protein